MNIVLPMAGRGHRFAKVGISTPKPLIDVLGKPMYAWATDSLPLELCTQLVFICQRDHLEQTPLAEEIQTRYARFNPVIHALDRVTEGQACTVLEAREYLDAAQPILIFNSDTYYRPAPDSVIAQGDPAVAGVLGVFRAEGDRWSFARTDDAGRVVETAEKVRISDWACTGLYHFASTRRFLDDTDRMIRENVRVNGEFYVAPVYNYLIREGLDVRIDPAAEAYALGTPEDLSHFLECQARGAIS